MTWSSAAVAAAAVAVAAAALAVVEEAPATEAADAAEAEQVEVVLVVGAVVVAHSLQGDAESTAEGVVAAAFEDGRGDPEAGRGGADVGCHSRLELGTEDVEAVAPGGAPVSDNSVAVVAADAVEFVASVDVEQPKLAQPSRLSERIWPTVASAQRERICQPYQANTSAPVCARCRNV